MAQEKKLDGDTNISLTLFFPSSKMLEMSGENAFIPESYPAGYQFVVIEGGSQQSLRTYQWADGFTVIPEECKQIVIDAYTLHLVGKISRDRHFKLNDPFEAVLTQTDPEGSELITIDWKPFSQRIQRSTTLICSADGRVFHDVSLWSTDINNDLLGSILRLSVDTIFKFTPPVN